MKVLIPLLVLILLSFEYSSARHISTPIMAQKQWEDYKLKFNKKYSDEEDPERFAIFTETLKQIEEHNEKYNKGEVSFSMGVNQFADLKPHEKKGYFGALKPDQSQ
ncbi:hypothetical protein PVAND_009560 [Polypedilum vanderplanki]|uniref:Cathepsin propeptide inhibitor domain-containing protein n=1 Tax=Polypedilum vanderplanki TaxID=319348 RepID=A0A9J6CE34_POLVA|nr:hypothetical protein PVAND_009560 [Polypedilum vanderplanki]